MKLQIKLNDKEIELNNQCPNVLIYGDRYSGKTAMANQLIDSINNEFTLIKDNGGQKNGNFVYYLRKNGNNVLHKVNQGSPKKMFHTIGNIDELYNELMREFELRSELVNTNQLTPMLINLDGLQNIMLKQHGQLKTLMELTKFNNIIKNGPTVGMHFIMTFDSNKTEPIDISNFHTKIETIVKWNFKI